MWSFAEKLVITGKLSRTAGKVDQLPWYHLKCEHLELKLNIQTSSKHVYVL
jgi:hypothetical protein